MKVKSNIRTARGDKVIKPGDVIELDNLTAERWIKEGYAQKVSAPKKRKPAVKKDKPKTSVPKKAVPRKKEGG